MLERLIILVSVWTLFILLPSFTLLNEAKYSIVLKTELSSFLDKLTLADALMNPQVVNLVLIFTLLYTALTLHTVLFGLAVPMSAEFDFPVPNQYLDAYFSQHTLMIRGLNPEIEVETARGKLITLFGERFPKTRIVSVHVLREKTEGVSVVEVK